MTPDRPILLFDGVCTLCDRSVQLVLDHEPEERIQFASLQSQIGQTWLHRCGVEGKEVDSVVFIDERGCHVRSDAALAVASRLDAPWRWVAVGRFLPRTLRDTVYDWVARNRYRWFGTRDACRLPTPATRARFLDADEASLEPPVAR